MAESISYRIRLAVLTEDRWLLNAALENVTSATDFAYIWIYGDKWKHLAHLTLPTIRVDAVDRNFDQARKSQRVDETRFSLSHLSIHGDRYVEVLVPVTSSQSTLPFELRTQTPGAMQEPSPRRDEIIGAVRLGLSLKRVDEQMASFLKWRGWSLAVFLCFSTLAIYIFSDRITRPINRLTEQAKRMSRGYLNEAIPVESKDEIGQLATAFNDMARALSEQYLGLEQKVAERTDELKSLNLRLAEASEHKSRFLANVNHELRTPLASIIGYARLLQREASGQITSLQRENLADLRRNAERLLGMIDSLLDFARIESGKLDVRIEPVHVEELVRGAAATVEPMLRKDRVRLVRDVPPGIAPLYTDPEKLRQIVLNLLGNAVKFTERGEIRISAQQENGWLELAVADTGIGIDPADVMRIFEEFDRGRLGVAGPYHGTGLGLAIVKRLVNLLGGDIRVESEAGKGAIFTVTLPLDSDSRAAGTRTGTAL